MINLVLDILFRFCMLFGLVCSGYLVVHMFREYFLFDEPLMAVIGFMFIPAPIMCLFALIFGFGSV